MYPYHEEKWYDEHIDPWEAKFDQEFYQEFW